MRTLVSLVELSPGQKAKVRRMSGGRGIRARLSALGIRPGVFITKVSTGLMNGPVVIQMQGAQVAIGQGMARRVIVEQVDA
jgi:ferrous iron transport protein A